MAVTINGTTGIETNTDTGKVKVGASDDIQIYHESGSSYITNLTGNTFVKTLGGQFHVRPSGDEEGLIVKPNGAVELYHNDVKKLETTNAGVKITGSLGLQMNACDVYIDDTKTVTFGGSNDLQIWHSGTESWIKNTTGDLIIRNEADPGDVYIQTGGAELGVKIIKDGACELYYDNTKQFSTGANGAYTESGVGLRCGSSGPINQELFTVQRNNGQVAYFDQSGTDDHTVLQVRHRGATGSTYRTHIAILDNDADQVGSIKGHGSATQFNTASDYRLKENEVLISDGITRLKTLKPYRFNFKKDPATTVDGFFAHEVTAVPEAIAGEKDGKEMQGLDYAKLTPLLTAALQEAITKIETLETEVNTLKTKVAALEAA